MCTYADFIRRFSLPGDVHAKCDWLLDASGISPRRTKGLHPPSFTSPTTHKHWQAI